MLNHILSNWKTSAAGLLSAVLVVSGVLSTQGVTLGHAGTGTVVTLAGAVAAALLGLMARDPQPSAPDVGDATKKLGVVLLCLLLWPALLPQTGCTVTQAQLVADGNALAAALTATAKVLSATDPATATRLLTAANAITAVTSNWQGTSSIAVLNAAASGAEVVLAAIPQTSIVAALLPIAVAALDVVLANTETGAAKGAPPALAMRAHATAAGAAASAANLAIYRARGAAAIHHRWMRSPAGDFKAAWNAQAAAAHLPQAAI